MLKEIPREDREGFVFNPVGYRDYGTRLRADTASKLIVKIGEAAGFKVAESASGITKHASAHDLRRAFGLRWSRLIMPVELKELMRHEEISTTMKFYVGQDAKQTVKILRQATANTLANTPAKTTQTPKSHSPQPVE